MMVSEHLSERVRVTRHLADAERAARARGVAGLDPARRLLRALLLDELARYRERGRFPRNLRFERPTPHFVDAEQTRCAVAHLLDVTGEQALVQRIARERNHARVHELADEPRLLRWLAAAGITLEEAAAIQPAYCVEPAACLCGGAEGWDDKPPLAGDQPADGVLVGPVLTASDGAGTVRIDAMYGDGAGYDIGSEIRVTRLAGPALSPGAEVVIPVHRAESPLPPSGDGSAEPELSAIVLSADSTFACRTLGQGIGPLTRDQLITALRAEDCKATVRSWNRKWGGRHCDDPDACTAAPGAHAEAPTTLGILLVLVSVLAARRTRRGQPGAP